MENRGKSKDPTPQEINALSTLFTTGRYPEAAALAQRMTVLYPESGAVWSMLGASLIRNGQRDDALVPYQKAVAFLPYNALAHYSLGSLLHEKMRLSEAKAAFHRAIELKPDFAAAHNNIAILLKETQHLPEAEAAYRRAIKLKPDFAEAHNNLGNLLEETQRLSEAEAAFRRAIECKPDFAAAFNNLGLVLREAKRLPESEVSFRRAIELKPDYVEAHNNLGLLLHDSKRLPEAEAAFRQVLELKSDIAEVHNNLGNLLKETQRLPEAEAAYHRALQIRPEYAEAHNNLGATLQELGRLDEAEASCRRALQIKPDFAGAHLNMVNILGINRLDEVIASFRQALHIKPDYVEAHSNLIFTLGLSASEDIASLQAERKVWGDRHAAPLYVERTFSNILDPERRLRIGYVSADFHDHAASRVFEGMLFYFDRQQYEVLAYSNNTYEDVFTQRYKQSVTGWRNIAGLPDDEVVDLIQQDQIDILVDLSGHSLGTRLLVVARKPAPIQITAWGHATGTGVKAIDVFFTDAVMVPPEEQSLYAETVRYLPCALCYSSDVALPPINALPATQKKTITFGSYNRLIKVSDPTITLWSRVLQAIPDSRLMLKSVELDDQSTRIGITERLVQAGIDTDRIAMRGETNWAMHMAAFNDIDIALDTFPQSGGMTTLDGLLMGIPVVTLRWPTITGRSSASILTTLGLTDWIAETEDEYVALAVSKVRDIETLAALRSTLRERFKGSLLGDAKAYVKIVEGEYRGLWRTWVKKQIKHDYIGAYAKIVEDEYREYWRACVKKQFEYDLKKSSI